MFWDNLTKLCVENNTTPTAVVIALGISKSSVTYWKSGKLPTAKTLQRIADHFGVTVDYLLGKTEPKEETPSDASTEERDIDKNIVRIIGRDGKRIEKRLTDEQLQALQILIDQLPDAPDDL
ncbi:MAG: helix-turn-helix transcriptional regulator [Ruminococcaceae bacterium]|nr:helix-turn-helix transcriptional regulator [Oscillospiraceae bacterium]